MHIWTYRNKNFQTKIKVQKQPAIKNKIAQKWESKKKYKPMGMIRGGGGEGELRAKDIRLLLQKEAKSWEEPTQQPGVVDKGKLKTW